MGEKNNIKMTKKKSANKDEKRKQLVPKKAQNNKKE